MSEHHTEGTRPMDESVNRHHSPGNGKPQYGIKMQAAFLTRLGNLIVQAIRQEVSAAFARMIPDNAVPPAARISLTPEEVALYCGISQQTLANWRHKKIGPPYIKAGNKKILYKREDIESWLERHKQVTNQTLWE